MSDDKLERIATFENEPLARLWENTLREEGIPSLARSLGAGPGAWGQVSSLPYGLYVPAGDARRAREVMGADFGAWEEMDDESLELEPAPLNAASWLPTGRLPGLFLLLMLVLFLALSFSRYF